MAAECAVEEKALHGIRVLDLTRVLAGPFCSMILADMGADVIKLEVPGVGDDSRQFPPFVPLRRNTAGPKTDKAAGVEEGEPEDQQKESMYYVNLNRGKRSLTLDLKNPDGKKVFLRLVEKCDVVLENFAPGTMERLGLGYETLKTLNPRLVYAAISGFGQTGPYRHRPGYDIISQAMSGLMSITGWPDSPPTRAGGPMGDVMAALFCCVGILSALHVRTRTGRGQQVDVALVDSLFASLAMLAQNMMVTGRVPSRIGNRYEFIYPYDSFAAADGWVIIAIANDSLWERFIQVTGVAEFADPRFDTNVKRLQHHDELRRLVEQWTASRNIADIVDLLTTNRIPAAPINTIEMAVNDPHIAGAREMIVTVEQPGLGPIRLVGNPIKMSATNPHPLGGAPALGEHTEEILRGLLGCDDAELASLRAAGALGVTKSVAN